jgi:prepilin-type N-terminal cleavage/methylation domain-containing protein
MMKNKGVSLIELIVSIVIFAIIIVSVVVFNTNNSRAVVKSERSAKRVLLQEKTIEEFKGYLKSASVPGSRFDGIWSDSAVGDILISRTDSAVGVSVRLEIDSFIPDQSADVSDAGVRLRVRVISTDPYLHISDTNVTLISRHD